MRIVISVLLYKNRRILTKPRRNVMSLDANPNSYVSFLVVDNKNTAKAEICKVDAKLVPVLRCGNHSSQEQ
jgi:hypothetical protein